MKTTFLALAIIISHFTIFSQPPRLDSIVTSFEKEKAFNGVVLLAKDGKINFCNATGTANRLKNIPIAIDSKFKIASMTKVFTAVLVMKLVEDGKIDLNKTIGDYFPAYAGEGRDKVTIHHLLTYSSGIQNITENLGMKPYQHKVSIEQFINDYCSGKLINEPGNKSEYSNTEYIILHRIIEIVSGKSYDDYLHQVILNPLKMTNTGICNSDSRIAGLVNSYAYIDSIKTFKPDSAYFTEMFFGAGAIYSTVRDLLQFDYAIFNNQLLKENTTDKLLTINKGLGNTAYGFWGSDGWGNFNEKFYYRTGGILGSTSNWIHTIKSKTTIIVLSNTDATNLYELSEKLYTAN